MNRRTCQEMSSFRPASLKLVYKAVETAVVTVERAEMAKVGFSDVRNRIGGYLDHALGRGVIVI